MYRFLDKEEHVIYIGKAKDLKKRVKSYFRSHKNLDPKTTVLVSKIARVEYWLTNSESEAFILERQLIQAIQPKYNIDLKDDKNYPWIKVTHEPFARVIITRQKELGPADYFGPYPAMGSVKQLQHLLQEIFPLRTCKKPIDLQKNTKKCLMMDLGRCLGPCVHKEVKAECDQYVSDLKQLISGKSKDLLKQWRREMKLHSDNKQYEQAAKTRDKIHKIESLINRQTVYLNKNQDILIWVMVKTPQLYYGLTRSIIEGKLLFQNGWYCDAKSQRSHAAFIQESFQKYIIPELSRYDECLCSEEIGKIIKAQEPHQIPIRIPQKGIKKEMVTIARKNAQMAALRIIYERGIPKPDDRDITKTVQDRMNLSQRPTHIIGFDVSHFYGTHIVASAVSFINGQPIKTAYRHYSVRSVIQKKAGYSHDPQAMYEVVFRRLSECLKKQESLPQLLVIDGGLAQLQAARHAVKALHIDDQVNCLALAKKFEAIYTVENPAPLILAANDPVRHFMQRIRDEAHRFAGRLQKIQRSRYLKKT